MLTWHVRSFEPVRVLAGIIRLLYLALCGVSMFILLVGVMLVLGWGVHPFIAVVGAGVGVGVFVILVGVVLVLVWHIR